MQLAGLAGVDSMYKERLRSAITSVGEELNDGWMPVPAALLGETSNQIRGELLVEEEGSPRKGAVERGLRTGAWSSPNDGRLSASNAGRFTFQPFALVKNIYDMDCDLLNQRAVVAG